MVTYVALLLSWLPMLHCFCHGYLCHVLLSIVMYKGLPGWRNGKEFTCQNRRHSRHGFGPYVEKFLWEGNGNPLQYSCLKKSMDRRAWLGTIHGVTKLLHGKSPWLTKHTYEQIWLLGLHFYLNLKSSGGWGVGESLLMPSVFFRFSNVFQVF